MYKKEKKSSKKEKRGKSPKKRTKSPRKQRVLILEEFSGSEEEDDEREERDSGCRRCRYYDDY